MQLKVENSGPRDTAIWIRLNTVFGAGDGQGINAGEGGPPAATPALNPKLLRYSPSLACWSQPPSTPYIRSQPDLPSGPASLFLYPHPALPPQSAFIPAAFPSNQSLLFYNSHFFFLQSSLLTKVCFFYRSFLSTLQSSFQTKVCPVHLSVLLHSQVTFPFSASPSTCNVPTFHYFNVTTLDIIGFTQVNEPQVIPNPFPLYLPKTLSFTRN